MTGGYARAAAFQASGDVHQAAHVAGENEIGAGRGDVVGLDVGNGRRNVRVLDAEQPAEPATGFRLLALAQFEPGDGGEERARLALDAELAQARAGIVIGCRRRQPRRDPGHASHVGEKRDQLMGLGRERAGARFPFRVAGEQLGVMDADHPGARAGRRDHVIERLEGGDQAARDFPRVAGIARIPGRLAATGLGARHRDRAAGFFEQLDGGEADGRAHQIDEAGDEQPDAGARGRPPGRRARGPARINGCAPIGAGGDAGRRGRHGRKIGFRPRQRQGGAFRARVGSWVATRTVRPGASAPRRKPRPWARRRKTRRRARGP